MKGKSLMVQQQQLLASKPNHQNQVEKVRNNINLFDLLCNKIVLNRLADRKKLAASAKYANIPIMSDKKCSKKWSRATRLSRMCTSTRDEKLICDVG